jgi:glutathione S-transferase
MTRISKLTLHHYPLSRSARVKWLLHELLGDDFETQRVALMQGQQFTPDFIAKNPNHGVPVLDVVYADGSQQTIYESIAILVFLADAYSEKGFAPSQTDLRSRADYLQMMAFGGSWMDMMLWQIRLNQDLLPRSVRSQVLADFNKDKFKNEVEPQLIARLSKHDFICGDKFTAADCMIGQNINWARAYKMCQDDIFYAYMKRMKQREGFQKAFADASEFNT